MGRGRVGILGEANGPWREVDPHLASPLIRIGLRLVLGLIVLKLIRTRLGSQIESPEALPSRVRVSSVRD